MPSHYFHHLLQPAIGGLRLNHHRAALSLDPRSSPSSQTIWEYLKLQRPQQRSLQLHLLSSGSKPYVELETFRFYQHTSTIDHLPLPLSHMRTTWRSGDDRDHSEPHKSTVMSTGISSPTACQDAVNPWGVNMQEKRPHRILSPFLLQGEATGLTLMCLFMAVD